MKTTLYSHQKRRDDLLAKIVGTLSNDDRFVAGWLSGSLGRNDPDELSDIDITFVTREDTGLCQRFDQAGAETSPERYALFGQFGSPALVHENNHNAPPNGTFTAVLYAESVVMVDWTLIPQANAVRPYQSRLLFDKDGISVSNPPEMEPLEQSREYILERWAFFWMMTAVTIKYIIRGDGVFVAQWIEYLNGMIQDMERHINRIPWSYARGSISQLQSTREKQMESIRQLCQRMQDLQPKAMKFTGTELSMPLKEIEVLLSLANK